MRLSERLRWLRENFSWSTCRRVWVLLTLSQGRKEPRPHMAKIPRDCQVEGARAWYSDWTDEIGSLDSRIRWHPIVADECRPNIAAHFTETKQVLVLAIRTIGQFEDLDEAQQAQNRADPCMGCIEFIWFWPAGGRDHVERPRDVVEKELLLFSSSRRREARTRPYFHRGCQSDDIDVGSLVRRCSTPIPNLQVESNQQPVRPPSRPSRCSKCFS